MLRHGRRRLSQRSFVQGGRRVWITPSTGVASCSNSQISSSLPSLSYENLTTRRWQHPEEGRSQRRFSQQQVQNDSKSYRSGGRDNRGPQQTWRSRTSTTLTGAGTVVATPRIKAAGSRPTKPWESKYRSRIVNRKHWEHILELMERSRRILNASSQSSPQSHEHHHEIDPRYNHHHHHTPRHSQHAPFERDEGRNQSMDRFDILRDWSRSFKTLKDLWETDREKGADRIVLDSAQLMDDLARQILNSPYVDCFVIQNAIQGWSICNQPQHAEKLMLDLLHVVDTWNGKLGPYTDQMNRRIMISVHCFTGLIHGFAKIGNISKAVEWLNRMKERLSYDRLHQSDLDQAFVAALNAYAEAGDPHGLHDFFEARRHDYGIILSTYYYSAMIKAWKESGDFDAPEHVDRIMEDFKRQYESSGKPECLMTNSVVVSLAASATNSPVRAQEWLDDLLQAYESTGNPTSEPTIDAFVSVMNKVSQHERAEEVEALMRQAEKLHDHHGYRHCQPNVMAYGVVMNTWKRQRRIQAAERAEKLLDVLEERFLEDQTLTNIPYNLVMVAYAHALDDKTILVADRVEAILRRMKRVAEQQNELGWGNPSLMPDTVSYTTYLRSIVRDGQLPHNRIDYDRLDRVMHEMEESSNARPDARAYGVYMNAIAQRHDVKLILPIMETFIDRVRRLSTNSKQQGKPKTVDNIAHNALLTVYAKAGLPIPAEEVLLNEMENPDEESFTEVMKAWNKYEASEVEHNEASDSNPNQSEHDALPITRKHNRTRDSVTAWDRNQFLLGELCRRYDAARRPKERRLLKPIGHTLVHLFRSLAATTNVPPSQKVKIAFEWMERFESKYKVRLDPFLLASFLRVCRSVGEHFENASGEDDSSDGLSKSQIHAIKWEVLKAAIETFQRLEQQNEQMLPGHYNELLLCCDRLLPKQNEETINGQTRESVIGDVMHRCARAGLLNGAVFFTLGRVAPTLTKPFQGYKNTPPEWRRNAEGSRARR